jgi:hypothetical protein
MIMHNDWQKLQQCLPVFLLMVAVFVFFSELVFSGKPLFGSDFMLYFHPSRQYLYNHVRSQSGLPFWNPHVLAGTPFLADMQTAMFYPLGFLFYLIPAATSYGYTVIVHCCLGALFMYLFVRSLNIDKAGSLLAAMIFTFNGYFLGHLYAGHLTFVQNYIWLPLVFFFANRLVTTARLRNAWFGGLFLGIQILGGFPQIAFYTMLAVLGFFSYLVMTKPMASRITSIRLFQGLLVMVILGFSLAAIQLFPSYEFTGLSSRSGGVSYEFATTDSLSPIHFLTFLMPNFFGNPANASYWHSSETWKFWELCGYVGIGPLLLLFAVGKNGRFSYMKRFFFLLAVLSLFLCLGRYNPLYRFIYQLPGFHHFRVPAQILYLYVFSISVLAGMALNNLRRKELPTFTPMIIGAGTAAVLLVLVFICLWQPRFFFYYLLSITKPSPLVPAQFLQLQDIVRLSLLTATGFCFLFATIFLLHKKGLIGPTPFVSAFVLVAVGDLWSFGTPMIRTTSLDMQPRKMDLVRSLDTDGRPFRLVTQGRYFGPNDASLYGYQDIHGYNPMILKRYLEYINKSQRFPGPAEAVNVRYITDLDNNLVRMLNVKYAITETGGIRPLDTCLPRAFVVRDAVTLPKGEILDFMASADFDPQRVVVLEQDQHTGGTQSPGPFLRASYENGKARLPVSDECKILSIEENRIAVRVSIDAAGYLVLSEINYPGWKAYVNGSPVEILTGDYLFRTVPLTQGEHDVVLEYEPVAFRIGIVITGFSLLLFIFVQTLMWTKRK